MIVENFINESFTTGYKKLIVVTGKGLRSQVYKDPYRSGKMSVLRYSVPEYIKNNENLSSKVSRIEKADLKASLEKKDKQLDEANKNISIFAEHTKTMEGEIKKLNRSIQINNSLIFLRTYGNENISYLTKELVINVLMEEDSPIEMIARMFIYRHFSIERPENLNLILKTATQSYLLEDGGIWNQKYTRKVLANCYSIEAQILDKVKREEIIVFLPEKEDLYNKYIQFPMLNLLLCMVKE